MALMGRGWPSLRPGGLPRRAALTDPTPNPTSRPPPRNPQYALQQPISSQALSEVEGSRCPAPLHCFVGASLADALPLSLSSRMQGPIFPTPPTLNPSWAPAPSCPRACGDPPLPPLCHPPIAVNPPPLLPSPHENPDPSRPRACGDRSPYPNPPFVSTTEKNESPLKRISPATNPPHRAPAKAGTHPHPLPCPRVCGDPSFPRPQRSIPHGRPPPLVLAHAGTHPSPLCATLPLPKIPLPCYHPPHEQLHPSLVLADAATHPPPNPPFVSTTENNESPIPHSFAHLF